MQVAIVHYWFITRRGGEKVVESILKLYPNADVYTLFYDQKEYGNYLNDYKVHASKYNTPFYRKYYQKLFPLYPKFINSLELRKKYDLIISSESGPAKGIKINSKTPHVCYIHSPMRYCWGFTNQYLQSVNPLIRPIAEYFFQKLKTWDKTTINNVDLYIANSNNVKKRVEKYYNKNALVIFPPIASKLFKKKLQNNSKNYYLSFGAITPYKRIDLLVDCFNKNGKKLIVIGNGSEKEKLKKIANPNIVFKGFITDDKLNDYIANAKALIFPGEEDFGMIPLEVMSQGVPVIAYKKGGALETVVENRQNPSESSGLFFKQQTVSSLQKSINDFEKIENDFNKEWIRTWAKRFEETIFLHKFSQTINQFLLKKVT